MPDYFDFSVLCIINITSCKHTHHPIMDFVIIVSILFSYILIRATFFVFGVGRPKNLPPGPTLLPIIGNLHLLGDQPHQSLAKLAETHGPIMSLQLGQITTLVISSATAAKEVLQKQDLAFSTRHVPDALNACSHASHSVAWLPVCTEWRTLRRILNSNIFSNNSLEANECLRSKKVEELIAYCRKASVSNDYVDIGQAAFRTSLNLLSNTIFSKDVIDPYEDSGKEFKEVITSIMVEAGKPNLVDFFPVLKKIDPQGNRRRMSHYFGKVLKIFEELIKERLKMGRLKHDDLLDVCLNNIQDNPNENNHTHMEILFLDLFSAGTDTTSSTLEWAMAEVLHNPIVMKKAKEELEVVIGKGKMVKENDVGRLPYLSCIVKETLRLHPPVPLLLPRKVVKQVQLSGYTILEGTKVLVNAWAIGRDPTIWDDSLAFKPQRFLESGRDVRGQDFDLIPFGAGRRICPGLPLAIRVVPVMLGSLLNNFDWSLDTNIQDKALDMSEKFGITLSKANPLCVVPIPLN
ncbi:putative geraniol 8-hydroxylase [Helianthus annuus]|nr:putative geraniol 8-hydroxylase [Helianthus annuus]